MLIDKRYIVKRGENIDVVLGKLNKLPNEKILFVIDSKDKLFGSISDGDINSEFAITSYDNSFDGMDDQVDGNESWFSISINDDSLTDKNFIDFDDVLLYPNPTTSIVTLQGGKQYDIEVYTLQGKKVMALTGNTIDMSHLSSATYIVKALDKVQNKEVSYKVVKN